MRLNINNCNAIWATYATFFITNKIKVIQITKMIFNNAFKNNIFFDKINIK